LDDAIRILTGGKRGNWNETQHPMGKNEDWCSSINTPLGTWRLTIYRWISGTHYFSRKISTVE
jgi:hypothetical protein